MISRPIAAIAAEIAEHGGNIERIHRTASYPVTAIEFVVSDVDQDCLRPSLATVANSHAVDIAVSPGGLMRWAKKLVVMDVDSTLIQQEVIELLGRRAGKEAQIKEITDRAMRGELDFEASLRQRVLTLKGLDEAVLGEVSQELSPTKGARELIEAIHARGGKAAAVSGGFIQLLAPVKEKLDFDLERANTLEVLEGKLTGQVIGKVIDRAAKAEALIEWANDLGLSKDQTIAVGDGANDLGMMEIAGLSVAFCAKPVVQEKAKIALNERDLSLIIQLLP
mgnify:CR=1 FL=1